MDFRRTSPAWDEDFEQLTRSMQERMDDFFRVSTPPTSTSTTAGAAVSPDNSSRTGRYERQPDGSLLYRVTFDVRDYQPGDLKTSLVGDRSVRVCGSVNRRDPQTGKHTSASFDEQFSLPDNVDSADIRSVVTNGQLIISAPVLPPQYAGKQTLQQQQQQQQQQQLPRQQFQPQLYAGSPHLSPRSGSPSSFYQQQPQKQTQPQQQQQQHQSGVRTISAFQLEVDVGHEFEPQDLTVATVDGGRRISVHGRREVKAAGKTSMREFRDEFDLPTNVDSQLVTARLRSDGRVIVDMPLLRETAGFTYSPVAVDHRS